MSPLLKAPAGIPSNAPPIHFRINQISPSTSNLVIGVYVGHDKPGSLGKFETGSKTAMPIFKEFVKNTVNNYEARPFKVAKGIKMIVVDAKTGKKASFTSKKTIIESFKKEKIDNDLNIDIDDLHYKVSKNNILKFY